MTRPHPHVVASVVGALMLGGGWLIAPRPGAVPSGWPPPWGWVWSAAVVAAALVVGVGMLTSSTTSVSGWLVQRAGHVALGALHLSFATGAAASLGWHALDAVGFVGTLGVAHLWLAWQMRRDLTRARAATSHPPDTTGEVAGWTSSA